MESTRYESLVKSAAFARQHRKPARIPTCGHPERKHAAKGLCGPCAKTIWNREHPDANTASGWHKRHPEAFRIHKRRASLKQHGLTLEQFDAMWETQGGRCGNQRCAIVFDKAVTDYRNSLQVDHCHTTGAVRGLLCRGCNTALGNIQDNRERLAGLIDYLSDHEDLNPSF